jgi:hypothetical protein
MGCHPLLEGDVVVKSVKEVIQDHLERMSLGSMMLDHLSVRQILDDITRNPGLFDFTISISNSITSFYHI